MNIRNITFCFGVSALAITVQALPVIDDSPTRVQTTLKIDFRPVGTLKPKSVGEVSASRWTLDCAGMDREHANWLTIRDYVAPLGIARIRQQGGWARCEKDPGIYDFAWLDQVVFDARERGISIWMELSYGNPAYPGGGGRQLSAGFPTSSEALLAWDRWVTRMVERYAGTVRDWCIWNEPDLCEKNDPVFAAQFAIRTAEIIRRAIPDANISAYALCEMKPRFVKPLLDALVSSGKSTLIDCIAYHHYGNNPDADFEQVEDCRELVRKTIPTMRLWEGEGGTWSEWGAAGANCKTNWTELRQAKYNLRRALSDLGHGDDTSVFHICDLEYRTSGFHDGLLRYGLVKTAGQCDGYRVLKVKTAYYAIQNAVSVFNDKLESLAQATTSTVKGPNDPVVYDWRNRVSGTPVVVYWNSAEMPTDSNETNLVELTVRSKPFDDPVWVDLVTGDAYAVPSRCVKSADGKTVYTLPAYDSPVFVTEHRELDLAKSWYVESLAQ